ncbi:SNARE domain-containing protein [Legionella sp. PATHC032]|uniref:SNARE domain-containing protein n=1 Tax=Legionella sp. PATHC032 TaxID=2992039 RepID=UPI001B0F657C|nr:SNARE domain-containing protein [Legionella sp. PATHC032]MCW8422330.1 SNARE domain-containing protein [Legionella sp. PATHC032]HAZ7574239.1 hypothetical protein [Legionella pneumophila]HBA1635795.1 hypothetical protein [Legionella pneumophila]
MKKNSSTKKILSSLSNTELQEKQELMMKEQDQQLNILLKTVNRTHEIAEAIHKELTSQNKLIDGLNEYIEKTDVKVENTTKRVEALIPEVRSSCFLM